MLHPTGICDCVGVRGTNDSFLSAGTDIYCRWQVSVMGDKMERVKTSLQIEEDIDLHIRGWRIQRIGWALMLLFVALAALGLFGDGVLSSEEVSEAGTTISFERFTRRENNTEVKIRSRSDHGDIEVTLPKPFLETFKIEQIIPEPSTQRIVSGSNVYTFRADGEGSVTLFLTAQQEGDLRTAIVVNDIDFPFHTYIYP